LHLSTWEAEAGGSTAGGQPVLHSETLYQKAKKKNSKKKKWIGHFKVTFL
jgi:hypothetical protein